MGLFSRRGTSDNGRHGRSNIMSSKERRQPKSSASYGDDVLNKRPSFGQWIKVTWPDILTMIVMGVLGLGVRMTSPSPLSVPNAMEQIYEAPPAPSRSFPVYFPDGQVVFPDFAYPLRHEIVPIWAAAMLASLVPIVVILLMQFRIRSFWDINNAILGLLYSLITAAVFQVFLKWLIGGLRPHFLGMLPLHPPAVTRLTRFAEVCKPDLPIGGTQTGNGFANIMYDRSICTGDKDTIDDSLESFPSGHTTAAFAGFVFLSLYLNAKLKVWSNYHPAYWKLIVTYMPILAAVIIGGSLSIDEYHNWWDILAGAVIGTVMAFSAYRMVYASVWDFRFNHIPLVRHVTFTHGGGGFDGFSDAMWTRQAGWGGRQGGPPTDGAQEASAMDGSGGRVSSGRENEGQGITRKAVPTNQRNVRADEMV